MKKSIILSLGLLFLFFLLNGCQKTDQITLSAKVNQDIVIENCSAVEKTDPDEEFGYLDKEFNDMAQSVWRQTEEINAEDKIYMGLSEWIKDEIKMVTLEIASPSGDWYRIDNYCFNKDGGIAQIYSDLRTFFGNVQVTRIWKYYSDGSIENSDINVLDLDTEKPIDPNTASYSDNPPYLTADYKDLLEHIGLNSEK
jgi:HAMP domain-containing protein